MPDVSDIEDIEDIPELPDRRQRMEALLVDCYGRDGLPARGVLPSRPRIRCLPA